MVYRSSDVESVRADVGSPQLTAIMSAQNSVVETASEMHEMQSVSPYISIGGFFGLLLTCMPRTWRERAVEKWSRSTVMTFDWSVRAAIGVAITAALAVHEDTKGWFFEPVLCPVIATIVLNATLSECIANSFDSFYSTALAVATAAGIQHVGKQVDDAYDVNWGDTWRGLALFLAILLSRLCILRRPVQLQLYVGHMASGVLAYITDRDLATSRIWRMTIDVAVPCA
ncbi:MAG: hypothetical protein MHM6MM_007561, partial [Cercozoa sp. M6MM]